MAECGEAQTSSYMRRALELYQDDIGRHDLAALKEAAIYVPHSMHQLSFHRGFSPQQWVLGGRP